MRAAAESPPRKRRLAALTLAEVRRLFTLIGAAREAVDLGIHWSNWRREHQAEARRHHIKRRLRLQTLQI
jgi:hypothetical protein